MNNITKKENEVNNILCPLGLNSEDILPKENESPKRTKRKRYSSDDDDDEVPKNDKVTLTLIIL